MKMILFYFFLAIIIQLFQTGKCGGEVYGKNTPMGKIARIDLLNYLKAALHTAHPKPTAEEQKAAITLVKFLNCSSSNDYLEAFYCTFNFYKANNVLAFLKGILYRGNSEMPVWNASAILLKMIQTKTNSNKLEKIRAKYKSVDRPRSSKLLNTSLKHTDYVKIFKDPAYFYIYGLIMEVAKTEGVVLSLPNLARSGGKLLQRRMLQKPKRLLYDNDLITKRVLTKMYHVRNMDRRPRSTHVYYSMGNLDNHRINKMYYRPYRVMSLTL